MQQASPAVGTQLASYLGGAYLRDDVQDLGFWSTPFQICTSGSLERVNP